MDRAEAIAHIPSIEAEARKCWPLEGPGYLGQWDGITLSAEDSYRVQRHAFEMGARWALEHLAG